MSDKVAEIDWRRFAGDVAAWLGEARLSYRQAAGRFDGVNAAMLSRAVNAKPLSVSSYLALCRALDLDPWSYYCLRESCADRQPRTTVKSILNHAVTARVSREAGALRHGNEPAEERP